MRTSQIIIYLGFNFWSGHRTVWKKQKDKSLRASSNFKIQEFVDDEFLNWKHIRYVPAL